MNAIQHNKQYFIESVYNRYKVPLLYLIQKYIGQNDCCEDIFHEVIVRIIKNVDLLSSLSQPKLEAYIFLVARGVSIDYLRTLRKKDEISLDNDFILDVLSQKSRHATINSASFKKVDIFIMMEKISVDDRILLIGKYYLGLGIKDLVDLVGSSPTTLRSKIFRARKKLLEQWTMEGLKMEDFLDE